MTKRPVAGGGSRLYLAAILGTTALVVVWQFAYPGYYYKVIDDVVYSRKFNMQFTESLRQGILYPRWMAESVGGYGLPIFNYYPPLLYFTSGVLGLAGVSLSWSLILLRPLGLCIGSVFIFHLLRERLGARAALFAAIAYILLPSRIMDVYFINTSAGRFCEVFLPMTLYFTGKHMEGRFSRGHLAGMSLSYAALILSHLVTAYIFTPFLALYGLFTASELPAAKKVVRLSLGLAAGICISSVFLVPVLFERGLAHLDIVLEHSYARNFLFNFSSVKPFEATEQLRSILENTVTAEAMITATLLYIAVRRKCLVPGRETQFFFISSLACLFMMSSLSGFVWKNVPGLKTIQFPYRINTLYLVFLPAFLGIILDKLTRRKANPVFIAVAAGLLVSLIAYDAMLINRSFPPVAEADIMPLLDRFDPLEYLPGQVDVGSLERLRKDDPALSSGDKFSAEISRWGYIDRAFSVDSPLGAKVRVKTFYFPGWKARVDGAETNITPEKGSGAILIGVPPGRHEVALKFTNTWPRTVGAIISILTLVALIMPIPRQYRGRAA